MVFKNRYIPSAFMKKHFNDEDYENTLKYRISFKAIDEAKKPTKGI